MNHHSEGKMAKIEAQNLRAKKRAERKARREARAKAKREKKKS